jgi:hypothetical protein
MCVYVHALDVSEKKRTTEKRAFKNLRAGARFCVFRRLVGEGNAPLAFFVFCYSWTRSCNAAHHEKVRNNKEYSAAPTHTHTLGEPVLLSNAEGANCRRVLPSPQSMLHLSGLHCLFFYTPPPAHHRCTIGLKTARNLVFRLTATALSIVLFLKSKSCRDHCISGG